MIKDYNQVQLSNIVETHYGMKTTFSPLGGYLDRNYLITSTSSSLSKHVLKISNLHQHQPLIRIQNHVLQHLATHKLLSKFKTPEIKPTLKGEDMIVLQQKGQKNFIRVFSFIEGKQMWDFQQLPDKIFSEVGELTAKLSLELQSLSQSEYIQSLVKQQVAMDFYGMNIMSFKSVYQSKKQFLDQEIFDIIKQVKLHYQEVEHIVHAIPYQIIHNDVCLSNILVNQSEKDGPYICGLIDFSSLVYGPRIIQLVMPCARINLYEPDPLKNMMLIIKAFSQYRQLTNQQKIVLFPMIKMRLAFLCLISCQQLALHQQSEYVQRCKKGHVHYLKVISKASTNQQFLEKLKNL